MSELPTADPKVSGKRRRRVRIAAYVAARHAAYTKWCATSGVLDVWDDPPLTYRQWCHPAERAKIQAALDGAYV